MLVPAELAGATPLKVSGRQGWKLIEQLQYGDFLVHAVQRSLTHGGSLKILPYEGAKGRQTFGFALSEQDHKVWTGECETTLRRRALDVGVDVEFQSKSGFGARLRSVADPAEEWVLRLEETHEKPLRGTLQRGDLVLQVTGTNRLTETPLPNGETTGYVFESAGKPVAAVEVINAGSVRLAPEMAPGLRGPVNAAVSALLLLEELRRTLPD